MAPRSPRRLAALAAGSALALAVTGAALSATAAPSGSAAANATANAATDGRAAAGQDTASAVVRLSLDPVAAGSTGSTEGNDLRLTSTAVKNERAQLAKQRNAFRQWLRSTAPQAQITGEYDLAVNAVAVRLNGTPLDVLRSAPGVVFAGYQSLYTPLAHQDPDLQLVRGQQGWQAASPAAPERAGAGIQVAVVDTGIDVTHPCFSDSGLPSATQLGDRRFTNNKVVVAKVFNNKAANQRLTPEAVQDHGTHVAGTVACNAHTPATVAGADIPYDPSGVAPGAQLGNYNVFPGQVGNARSEDILNALQAAAEDGMDVINMSLGGGASGNQDLLTMAVDNLDRAGIVVAVASGNSGPGLGTVESPGSAERALTAGASTVGHFVGTPIKNSAGDTVAVAAIGDFPTPAADLTAVLDAAAGEPLGLGCSAGDFAGFTDGAIALVSRGACSFSQKVANAEAAGAVAAVIVNNVPGDPIAMATDPAFGSTIPAVQAGLDDRAALRALVGQQVTIGSQAEYTDTGNDNIMAAFSSQGPTDVSFRVKPDAVAPGVNVLSSVPATSCQDPEPHGCWAFFQGTSMATPHLAGMAAVVMHAHPSWTAEQVRSAIVNTAQEGVLKKSTAITVPETDVQVTGAGLADLEAAVDATLALSSVSTSFGAVPAGSGQTLTRTVTVTDLSGTARTIAVGVDGDPAFSVAPASVSVPANGSATLTVSFSAGKQAAKGGHQAMLRLGGEAHSVLFAFVK